MQNNIDNHKHQKTKMILKILGPILLLIGLASVIIGIVDMGLNITGSNEPKLFFLMMLGFPLIAIGLFITIIGNMQKINSYVVREQVPTTNETLNNLASSIGNVANTVRENVEQKKCPNCGKLNDINAKYCNNCGKPLVKICPNCNKENGTDATYCNNCGTRL